MTHVSHTHMAHASYTYVDINMYVGIPTTQAGSCWNPVDGETLKFNSNVKITFNYFSVTDSDGSE